MNMLLMLIYPIFLVIAPVVIYQFIMAVQKNKSTLSHYLWTYIFMIYIWLVFSVTGLGSIYDMLSKGGFLSALSKANLSLIPFQSNGSATYFMNVFMVMPLGFLLPFIWKNFRNVFKTTLVGFTLSVLIEFSQLFTNRLADIDDIVMNTLGAVLGYMVWKALGRVFFPKKASDRTKPLSMHEPVIYIVLAYACHFLLYNWTWFI